MRMSTYDFFLLIIFLRYYIAMLKINNIHLWTKL